MEYRLLAEFFRQGVGLEGRDEREGDDPHGFLRVVRAVREGDEPAGDELESSEDAVDLGRSDFPHGYRGDA